ncbi:MAG: PEP-CTERM sorting domain-containing protein [Planctomycetia bacterium]|nr:PEP-CTERM sorting domain-containing protein [Planctomycetia bacterium]
MILDVEKLNTTSGGTITSSETNHDTEIILGWLSYKTQMPNPDGVTYSGSIDGTLSVNKVGENKVTLEGGTLTYTGKTTVTKGTLELRDISLNNTSSVDIKKDAVFELYHSKSAIRTFGSDDADNVMEIGGEGTFLFKGTGTIGKTSSGITLQNVDFDPLVNDGGNAIIDGARVIVATGSVTDKPLKATIVNNGQLYVYPWSNEGWQPTSVNVDITVEGNGVYDEYNEGYFGAIRLQSANSDVINVTPSHIFGNVTLAGDASISAYRSIGDFAADFDLDGNTLTVGTLNADRTTVKSAVSVIEISGKVTSTEDGYEDPNHIFTACVKVLADAELGNTTLRDGTVTSFHDGSDATWMITNNITSGRITNLKLTTLSPVVELGSLDGNGTITAYPYLTDGVNRNIKLKLGGTNRDNPLAFNGQFVEDNGTEISVTKVGIGTQNLENGDDTYTYMYSGVTTLEEGILNVQGHLKNSLILAGGTYSAGAATGAIGTTEVAILDGAVNTATLTIGGESAVSHLVVDIQTGVIEEDYPNNINATSDLIETKDLVFTEYGKKNFSISLNELSGFAVSEEYKAAVLTVESGLTGEYAESSFWDNFLSASDKPFWYMLVEGNTVYAVHDRNVAWIPEPSSFSLLGLCVVFLIFRRKRVK